MRTRLGSTVGLSIAWFTAAAHASTLVVRIKPSDAAVTRARLADAIAAIPARPDGVPPIALEENVDFDAPVRPALIVRIVEKKARRRGVVPTDVMTAASVPMSFIASRFDNRKMIYAAATVALAMLIDGGRHYLDRTAVEADNAAAGGDIEAEIGDDGELNVMQR